VDVGRMWLLYTMSSSSSMITLLSCLVAFFVIEITSPPCGATTNEGKTRAEPGGDHSIVGKRKCDLIT
jgi:hypothetical protein